MSELDRLRAENAKLREAVLMYYNEHKPSPLEPCNCLRCCTAYPLLAWCETCSGTRRITAYRGEPSQGTEEITCPDCRP